MIAGLLSKTLNWLKSLWKKLNFLERAWLVAIIVFVPLMILNMLSRRDKSENENKTEIIGHNKESEKTHSFYTYDIIGSENYAQHDNYYFLLNMRDKSETNVEAALREIKNKVCERKCNIIAYDDKKAFELDRQMEDEIRQIPPSANNYGHQVEKIEAKYYLKMADHLIGMLS